MKILILGFQNKIKDTVVALAMESLKTALKKPAYVSFDELIADIFKKETSGNAELIKSLPLRYYDSLGKKLTERMISKTRGSEHMVIDGYCFLRTKHGHIPLLNASFMEMLKPELIFVLETIPEELTKSAAESSEMDVQNQLNRLCAAQASLTGSALRVFAVSQANERQVSREITRTVKEAMV